ncbi:uncharacterized protein LOC134264809 [Saccostrea cucullata]|uniref:uncharacterized protein LOC134264809 n=1 Tax=Saccostrea cuccullata TaxID=36930 RepID=UPI002ED16754
MMEASFSHLQNSSKEFANNMIALVNHTETSTIDLRHMFKQHSNEAQTTINEIGNLVEASLSQLHNSSNDISHKLKALFDHTNTSLIDVKDMLKDQSNEIKSLLGDMIKDVLKELKNELKTVIESSIGGGCVNNSLNVTTGECVDSCLRVADGDYQSCDTCHGYVTCANNYIYQRNCSTDHLEWMIIKNNVFGKARLANNFTSRDKLIILFHQITQDNQWSVSIVQT